VLVLGSVHLVAQLVSGGPQRLLQFKTGHFTSDSN
jgi:hypothetical protein